MEGKRVGRSGRQPLAALGAAVGQDRPARTGAHPSPEAMLACPTPVIGLERALHVGAPGECGLRNVLACALIACDEAPKSKGSSEKGSNRGPDIPGMSKKISSPPCVFGCGSLV